MAKADNKPKLTKQEDELQKQWDAAWQALTPIRSTWDEKELALLAQTNDSFSGKVTHARITDAALSTLSFERQARVAAQLPTGRVIPQSSKDEDKAKLLNVILNRYIIPNADAQHPMLVKQRLWGVYASVYGSMPMFYDYRVDDRYIGPDAWLVDPRCFAIQPGFSSIQDADYAFISNMVSVSTLKGFIKRTTTTWNKAALRDVIKQAEANDATPSRDFDAQKIPIVQQQRYNRQNAKGRVELITKYESGDDGHWITFAPDFDNKIVRDIPNPHKSGRIPIVMRHCFPLMNSIFGLGDYERGMRIQKAKDSLTNLFLEGAKNRIFPPLMINTSNVTLSTIKNQANARWIVQDMNNGVRPVQYGSQTMSEYQSTWGSLQSMLMNQFGTTDTTLNKEDTGNPAFGKTPAAISMTQQRQNSRDTWDMFMHEKASEELYEGMMNLLTVKMEKPINFTIFEEEVKQIEREYAEDGKNKGVLDVFGDGKTGKVTASKKQLASEDGYKYIIDSNSSMSQNAQEQFQALSEVWQITHQDPNISAMLQQQGIEYDEAEHLKNLFISAGVTDWDKILKEVPQDKQSSLGGQPQGQPPIDPQMMQQMMEQQQAQAQSKSPVQMPDGSVRESADLAKIYVDPNTPGDIKQQIEHALGLQPSQIHAAAVDTTMSQHLADQMGNTSAAIAHSGAAQQNANPAIPNFNDPEIQQAANQLLGGR